MIIGAGLPTFLENPLFEKFSRTARALNLDRLENADLFDIVFNPLQNIKNYTRYEVSRWFEIYSLNEIIKRSDGNPLHVKIICATVFDYFKENKDVEIFELNRAVMEKVMEYYSQISEKSRKIRRSLESCKREQLEAFSRIFEYAGFSIKAAITIQLAFSQLTTEMENEGKNNFLNFLNEIIDLGLFEFNKKDVNIENFRSLSLNKLADVEYKFIGDPIDRLYASYFYEDLTHQILKDNQESSFEDMLAIKFSELIDLSFIKNIIPNNIVQHVSEKNSLVNTQDQFRTKINKVEDVIEDLDLLKKLSSNKKAEKHRDKIKNLSRKYALEVPSHAAKVLDIKGYYLILSDLNIKGKRRFVFKLFPLYEVTPEVDQFCKQINNISELSKNFHEYLVSVNSIFIYWLPSYPLLLIQLMDVSDLYQNLIKFVAERKFDNGVQTADLISDMDIRIEKDAILARIDTMNNLAFCLMNIGKFEEAITILKDLAEKSIISKINLAYGLFRIGQISDSKRILSKFVRKKIGKNYPTRFMHLAIGHNDLSNENLIVEDCKLFNVAAWNSALINAKEKNDSSIINSFIKKIVKSKDEKFVHCRVLSWIDYYQNKFSKAVDLSNEILKDCEKTSYIHKDVLADLVIFQNAIK
jgi:hypothetical protein